MRFVASLLLVACASTPPPAPSAPPPEPPPLIPDVPAPPPVELPPPPKSPTTVLGYAQCPLLFVEGESSPRGTPPKLTVWPILALATYPDPSCAPIDGWAGVSIAKWGLAGGFSADGTSYLHCGNGTPSCALIDVASHAVIRPYPAKSDANTAPDGIFSDPTIKRGVRYYKITTTAGPWAEPDIFVRWSIALAPIPGTQNEHVRTLSYSLHNRTSGTQVELATFQAPPDNPLAVILPEPATTSPDGKSIALRATLQSGQTLTQMLRLITTSDALSRLTVPAP